MERWRHPGTMVQGALSLPDFASLNPGYRLDKTPKNGKPSKDGMPVSATKSNSITKHAVW
jgi:hypothetical protein